MLTVTSLRVSVREVGNLVMIDGFGSPAGSRRSVATRARAGMRGMDGMNFVSFVSFARAASRGVADGVVGVVPARDRVARALLARKTRKTLGLFDGS